MHVLCCQLKKHLMWLVRVCEASHLHKWQRVNMPDFPIRKCSIYWQFGNGGRMHYCRSVNSQLRLYWKQAMLLLRHHSNFRLSNPWLFSPARKRIDSTWHWLPLHNWIRWRGDRLQSLRVDRRTCDALRAFDRRGLWNCSRSCSHQISDPRTWPS